MQIHLAYGKEGLDIELPSSWNVSVVEPRFVQALNAPLEAITDSLRNPTNSPPLRELASQGEKVGIIFSDITRPTPYQLILPAVLNEVKSLSHSEKNITLFNACGTHRVNTNAELRYILGDEVVDNYRIVQNDAYNPKTFTYVGKSSRNNEIWLNSELMDCDLVIMTGFIEPHFFAGFSGGGKAIMPGMAALSTILANHSAANIGNPKSVWGITDGNPVWEEVCEVAGMVGKTFLVNVTLNKNKDITAVFSGDMEAAHKIGTKFVTNTAMVPVSNLFDIVLTTNSGYPLDLNLYQSVKGLSAASLVTRPGGAIIIAAECWDGVPEHGLYGQMLKNAESHAQLLEQIHTPCFSKPDQWQVQIQAMIQQKAEVFVYSDHLSDAQIHNALFKPCQNILQTISELRARYGSDASICVLPEGPQTVPYVEKKKSID